MGDGFAVIEGLNNDAPVGCSLQFVSGASGVLLWRRSDNICYALLLGGAASLEVGEAVECRVRAILQARRLRPCPLCACIAPACMPPFILCMHCPMLACKVAINQTTHDSSPTLHSHASVKQTMSPVVEGVSA